MALYRYVKAAPKKPIHLPRVISMLCMGFGAGILLWVAWPILHFSVFTAPLFQSVISPLQTTEIRADSTAEVSVLTSRTTSVSSVIQKSDYTDPNIWYPTKPQKKVVSRVNTYTLSIPKLGIKDAITVVAGDDLDKNLIHYGGTALPGEHGNGVIFGHSVLPQFFDQRNYLTIFSTLPTLETGDDIFVRFDNVTYRYKVIDLSVRDPSDLTALEQQYDDSYITLITCVPPGTYWKRLNVRARLISI